MPQRRPVHFDGSSRGLSDRTTPRRLIAVRSGLRAAAFRPTPAAQGVEPEKLRVPATLTVICLATSTYARLRIIVNTTSAEACREACLNLEFSNSPGADCRIDDGEGICQLLFFESDPAPPPTRTGPERTSTSRNGSCWPGCDQGAPSAPLRVALQARDPPSMNRLEVVDVALPVGAAVPGGILSRHVVDAEVVREPVTLDVSEGDLTGVDGGAQRFGQAHLHIGHRWGLEPGGDGVLAVPAPGTNPGFDLVALTGTGSGHQGKGDKKDQGSLGQPAAKSAHGDRYGTLSKVSIAAFQGGG